jgi:Flp pilus assembly protein TadD
VHYRLKQYDQAIEQLEKASDISGVTPKASNQFFLAMSYQADGQLEQVASCLLNAVTWWAKQDALAPDLALTLEGLRREAEMLMQSSSTNSGSLEPGDKADDNESGNNESGNNDVEAANPMPPTD